MEVGAADAGNRQTQHFRGGPPARKVMRCDLVVLRQNDGYADPAPEPVGRHPRLGTEQ